MYLNIAHHKNREAKIIAIQARGWIFESHCWVDEGGWPRTCKWCGITVQKDMTQIGTGKIDVCPENPMIKEFIDCLKELVEIIDNDEKNDIDSFTTQPARLCLKKCGITIDYGE